MRGSVSMLMLAWCTSAGAAPGAAPPKLVVASSTTANAVTKYESLDRWYGWQLVVADQLVGAAIFWTSVATSSEPLLYTWIAFGIVNGPILHLANGNGTAAWQSLLLRLIPPATGALGAYVGGRFDDGGKSVWLDFSLGVIIGAIVGWQLTSAPGAVLDYAFLSWHEDKAPEPEGPQIGIVPVLAPTPSGDVVYGLGLRVNSW